MAWLCFGLSAVVGLYLLGCAFSARTMVRPGRQKLWTDPKAAAGIDFEAISFPAPDGVTLRGWFLPAPAAITRPAPTLIIIPGWLWNRLGNAQNNLLNDFPGGKRVELMPLASAYHQAGYSVLMFDVRGFGESDRSGPYTAGWQEHLDLLGALDWLQARPDVDAERIGAIGFSNGGNCIVFALAHTEALKAAIAVQPTKLSLFMANYMKPFGLVGRLFGWGTGVFYRLGGGPDLRLIDPLYALRGAARTPTLYVEGTGDRWGSVAHVQTLEAATPVAEGLYPETGHRFDGYNHMVAHPELSLAFFGRHLGPAPEKVE
ncbi:MAG: prolyl oligopeptidase family serine peptidase [Myxococcales bacterium]|nr:prolyl oligopeptidase family serine peptidase [Myxococcales bacterium]